MERRKVPHSFLCTVLPALMLLSSALCIVNASKVLDEVPLGEEVELDWRHSRWQRYLGESDDEDFVSSAEGSADREESSGVSPEPGTISKGQTVYYRVLVNFTKSIEYDDELEDFNSERFTEVSEAIIDTLESQFIRIPGEQTVTVVLIEKVGEDIIVQLDVGSEGNNNDQEIEDVVYSMARSGSFGPYQSSTSGFLFRRLGTVDEDQEGQCQSTEFTCKSGDCIPIAYFCDDQPDCLDMSDEDECGTTPYRVGMSTIRPAVPTARPIPTRTQLRTTPATQTRTLTPRLPVMAPTTDRALPLRPCSTDQAVCQNGQCIPRDYLCDGEKDCEDGSDELDCGTQSPCEPNEFKCRNGHCALKLWRCDGDTDCADGSDEEYCPTKGPGDMCAPEQFVCVSSRTCIPASYQCDEEPDCPDRSDEFGCTSPQVVTLPEETVQTTRGATVTLTCVATGVPTPIITWRLNWGPIPVSSRTSMTSQNGQGTLIIRDVKESDQGAYTCEAINAKGMIFAIPDAVLILRSNSGNCPGGHFSVDGSQRCIPCFCFGVTKICDATGRYQTQISLRFNENDDFKGVSVTVPAQSGTPPLSTSQILVDTDSAELQLVDLSRRFLNHDSFWTLPRQFLGNKVDSYGGFLRYKIRYSLGRGQSEPENKADVIIVGNGKKLIYKVKRPSQPSVTNQKEIQFLEDNWQHASGGAVTREDLMMALVNLEKLMIRAKYDNRMASVGLSDVVMDTTTAGFTRLGKAQMVEECRCPTGYTGLSCETCAAGFNRIQTSPYLGTCNGCNCNSHASTCDKVTGHCLSCQHNTEGSRCDKCRAGYFGNPTLGTPSDCMPCPCPFTGPSRRFSNTCFLDTDKRPTCDACAEGYTGRRCEKCASGYEGNPMIEGGGCKQVGFLTKCDDKGTDPKASIDGSCQCKLNVVGRLCNKCSPGSFHLDAANVAGCLTCFCMGVTQQCASSTWHRDQVQAGFERDHTLYRLTNMANTLLLAEGIRISGLNELAFGGFDAIPQDVLYWVLPDRFKGDKVTSYGGELRYIILHRVSPGSPPIIDRPDVVLQGNNIFLEYYSTSRPKPGVPTTFTVPLRESGWRRTNGQPCSREHLLMALAQIDLLMIRATFAEKMLETRISKIRMDIAVPHYTGQEQAVEVEECICPQGYRGPSCQNCASGYTRTAGGLYLGTCEPCNCFGHSNECDEDTGKCRSCQDNTEGKHCERCRPGFYGDAKGRTHSDCQVCPCPGTTASNQFSPTCFLDSDGRPTCDNCHSGYGGRNCERCAPGYTGNPIYGQPCTQAGCSCDGRGSATDRCDASGLCQCKSNVEGRNCNMCRTGFFFLDAGNRDGCLPCFCMGVTQQCRSSTYYRDTIVTPFFPPSNFQNFALVNRQRTTKITSGFTVEITNEEPLLSFRHFGPESYFWQLPEPYQGDKREQFFARIRRGQQKDPSLTEVQLRKDAAVWQLLDSSSSLARSKRSSQSSPDLEEQKRIDDEIWAIITGFTSQQDSHTPSPASGQNLSLSSRTFNRPGPVGPPAPSASHTNPLHSLSSSSRVAVSHSSQPSSLLSSPGQYARPSATQVRNPSLQGKELYALVYKGFSLLPESHYYWQLPHHYLGNKVASYGGRLKYTLSYNAGYRASSVPDSDVQITGNDITLVANHHEQLRARETKTFEIVFKEQLWKRPDGQAATREHLLMVLADLDEILIRATFTTDMISASIGGVSMETAVAAYTSRIQAQEVEECRCPPGYTGLSCQDCAPGYARTGGGLYLGHCELCECSGHSESCHPETRVCSGCLHGTTGEFCNFCAAGYYGDATAGTPEDCQRCACPLSSQENQFSPTCESSGDGGYRCTSCAPGYTGQYCESCAPGYTGNPNIPGQKCLPFDRIPLLIRVVPERVTVSRGDRVQLKCQVSGQGPYRYSWTRADGRPLSRRVIQRNRGEELFIQEIEPSDAGVYLCVCRNAQSTNTSRAEVVVSVPPFKAITVTVEEPKIQTVRPGVTINFICTAKSQSPAYTLVWTRQLGGKLPDTAVDFNGILTIRNVRPEDAGGYICTGSNMFAMDEGSAVLHVPATAQVRYQAFETLEGHRLSTAPSAPVAAIEPQILTVKQGQTAELRCTATGNPPPTLQWSGGQGSVISPNAVVRGGLLRIAAVERSDEAVYFCQARNTAGEHTARTIIYVQSNGNLPQVQVSPQQIDVYEGETVRLYCRAGGHPTPMLSWKKLGGVLPAQAMNLFGFLHMGNGHNDEVSRKRIWELQARAERTDIGTLIIPSIAAAHGGVYLCVGSNSAGSAEGRIEVTVITSQGSPPRVRVHPSPASVTEGGSLELVCQARGQPEPTLTWHRAGSALTANHQVLGSRLQIVKATVADAGDYSCEAENSLGRERATVSVSVTSLSTPARGSPPRVRVHPAQAFVTEGGSLELACQAQGQPEPTLTWHRMGSALTANHQVLGSRLQIVKATVADAGDYSCEAENSLGRERATVSVSVTSRSTRQQSPIISTGPQEVTVIQGHNVSLKCEILEGAQPLRIEWITPSQQPQDNISITGAGTTITITNVRQTSHGQYKCVAGNRFGLAYSTVTLIVQGVPTVSVSPRGPVRLGVRDSITVECISKAEPRPVVSWHRIEGRQRKPLDAQTTQAGHSILKISSARVEDSGTYLCQAVNQLGSAESRVEVLVDLTPSAPTAPQITVEETTSVATTGGTTTLHCSATGYPTPVIQWSKLRAPLPWQHKIVNGSLVIPNLGLQDSGQYICNASNSAGFKEIFIMLDVESPPYATFNNEAVTVRVGEVIRLQCLAQGTPPLQYQWSKLGGKLPSRARIRDGVLQINLAVISDSDTYSCLVKNKVGESEATATVRVRSPLAVRVTPQIDVKNIGGTVEFTCSVIGDPKPRIQWLKQGGHLPPDHKISKDVLRISNLQQENEGIYICRATSRYEQAQDSAKLTIQALPIVMINVRTSVQTVMIGGSVEFECQAIGDPQPVVGWSKVEGTLPPGVRIGNGMLKIANVKESDAGRYRCTATNQVGSVESEVVLHVQTIPRITPQPEIKEVAIGSSAVFPCLASGFPAPDVTWTKLEGDLPAGARVDNNVLTIQSATPEHTGTYVCTATNEQGTETAYAMLKVRDRVVPYFTQDPVSYIALPTIKDAYHKFEIRITFRPDAADALILYSGMIIYNGQKKTTGADFISFGLVGGRPEFRFDVGSGMATIRHPNPISLGEYHTVVLQRNLTQGSLSVDHNLPVSGTSQGSFRGLDLNEDLYVGGYPDFDNISKATGLDSGFMGCIRQLTIQGDEVIFSLPELRATGISNCPTCKDKPCKNGGNCVDSDTSRYVCLCKRGFTGSNCEHSQDLHCHPEACGPNATCVNRADGLPYICRCHLGKRGPKCMDGTLVTAPSFRGRESFVSYPALSNIHNELTIEMRFKPRSPTGLMFFSSGKRMKMNDFVSVALDNGFVEFRYDLGSGLAILQSLKPVTLNKWHQLRAHRYNKEGSLHVDNDLEVRQSSPGKSQGLNLRSPMYLGGVATSEALPKALSVTQGMDGCIAEVLINGKKVDLSYTFTASLNVGQCYDNLLCDTQPCLHGGTCLATAESEYQCLCPQQYQGERCEVYLEPCSQTNPCMNGGTCERNHCFCPMGFTGQKCELDSPVQYGAFFHDEGYIALPRQMFPRSTPRVPETIEMKVRTRTSNGLLLWQGVVGHDSQEEQPGLSEENGENGKGKDYVALGLRNGHLLFSYQLGSGEANILSEDPINDGEWHKITAVREGKSGHIQVDEDEVVRGESTGDKVMVNTKGSIYLGGAPDIKPFTGGKFTSGITGCIKDLLLLNQRPDQHYVEPIDLRVHAEGGVNAQECPS
ncbi:basement membrane-specific heparan sulfate proteoglycan core protein [Callorhinchus milii]|uniref:basement membrane-specific heparan sulfate proteoglycan core protein n=1 Tax=Callorhinchus milii TaxID=7868 RepID=UPI001C3F7771|nr:basement membrane-specific heparan sulfate proteoglycan core protein [Callorhinchus milii]